VALTPGARYVHIAADIRAKIADGTYSVGEALPSTAELMRRYEASNTAVRAAIKELTIEGLVVGQQGRGVYVQDKPRRGKPTSDFAAISAQIEALREALEETSRQLDERLSELESEFRKLRPRRRVP
jgi:GntR family transcriptional regulator